MYINNNVILNTIGVPKINNFSHLAKTLSLTDELLFFLSMKKEYCYKFKKIKKKDGSCRVISIPHLDLKVVQRWILKEILEKVKVSPYTMAFVPKKNGLRDNAIQHCNNVFLLHLDIRNYFGTISEKKVFQLFCNIGYNFNVSAILTNLCTIDGVLPQGAVTSPYIANLVSYHLDMRLSGLCSRQDIVYTRYADDLCFSSNNRVKLNRIEKIVKEIIVDEGFEINDNKTYYLSNSVKKVITGITINNKEIHVEKKYKREIRSMIYNSIVKCDYSLNSKIRGSIAYVNSIEPGYKDKIIKYIESIVKRSNLRVNHNIVKSFNNNKIYQMLPDMKVL